MILICTATIEQYRESESTEKEVFFNSFSLSRFFNLRGS